MTRIVGIPAQAGLAEHAAVAHLAGAVDALRETAQRIAPVLHGRTLWMVNSTAQGGGVAEMLPGQIALLRELGLHVEWAVIESDDPRFFEFTKHLHNLIHDAGEPGIDPSAVALYEEVNRANAATLLPRLRNGDIVVVHDPQPLPLAAMLREHVDVHCIFRCHIGLDDHPARTGAAWSLMRRYTDAYARVVFSAAEYVPDFLDDRTTIIQPALAPLAAKNRDLSLHKVTGILSNGGLSSIGPTVTPPYEHRARRIAPDGAVRLACDSDELGLLSRPIVTQISRWDRLKGFLPLMQAFARLKRTTPQTAEHGRRVKLARLVLAGPAVDAVTDDPESAEVVAELRAAYLDLPDSVREDIALVLLPMASLEQNALMVNALQRASSIVVQNSLREGFGLTIAEAMWKRVPVLSSARACGPRHQIRDGIEGRLVPDPEDVADVAATLDAMLADRRARETWARNAQRRAHDDFMVFTQLGRWLELLRRLVAGHVESRPA